MSVIKKKIKTISKSKKYFNNTCKIGYKTRKMRGGGKGGKGGKFKDFTSKISSWFPNSKKTKAIKNAQLQLNKLENEKLRLQTIEHMKLEREKYDKTFTPNQNTKNIHKVPESFDRTYAAFQRVPQKVEYAVAKNSNSHLHNSPANQITKLIEESYA